MKTIIVASRNRHKVKEIRRVLAALPYEILDLEVLPDYASPRETGETFSENARIKAQSLRNYLTLRPQVIGADAIHVLADDSGLECDDLDGLPGVLSARFAGENATDEENNQKLLEMFREVTHLSRAARYVCALVLVFPDGRVKEITETCPGRVVLSPRGENGFGYDPYFFIEEYGLTMAEITLDAKNKISHRGKAMRTLVEYLEQQEERS